MSQRLILIDALSSVFCCLGEKKWKEKKKKKEMARELFTQGWTCFSGCATWDFCSC
jgi:hypothetical protein